MKFRVDQARVSLRVLAVLLAAVLIYEVVTDHDVSGWLAAAIFAVVVCQLIVDGFGVLRRPR